MTVDPSHFWSALVPRWSGVAASLLCVSLAGAAAAQPIIQPGAPGQPSRRISAEQSQALTASIATPEDVKFMQDMIVHHSQALTMVELLKARTYSEDMRLLGQRIAISQAGEIDLMREWLRRRGFSVTAPHEDMAGMHMDGMEMAPMVGMLSPAQMRTLAGVSGPRFDALFLSGMIQHHEGALAMVQGLENKPGAAEDSELGEFLGEVTADQSAEIARMRAMLAVRRTAG